MYDANVFLVTIEWTKKLRKELHVSKFGFDQKYYSFYMSRHNRQLVKDVDFL